MRVEDLSPDELTRLGVAAIVGAACLAHELELVGLSDEHDSLDDAKSLRPLVLQMIDDARGD